MLIEFRVQNHRSIRTEQAFTMEAGRSADQKDHRPRTIKGFRGKLLPAAAIYGANASGKSNVLSALGFMRDAVVDSHQSWPPQGGVPRDAFAWGAGPVEPSLFETTLIVEGVRLEYGFVLDSAKVLEEWLYAWPRGRRQVWLERDGDDFVFGEHLRGENHAVEQVTRPNALFLSAAVQHHHEQLLPIYEWFRGLRTIRVEGYRERYSDAMPAAAAASMFAALAAASAASAGTANGMVRLYDLIPRPGEDAETADEVALLDEEGTRKMRELLEAADVGIADFRVEGAPTARGKKGEPKRVVMYHEVGGDDEARLDLERESAGTRAIFNLGPALIDVLRRGGVLVVDELEASLHPLLAMEVVKQFNDPRSNPQNAQLVFTTHDTALLGILVKPAPLRRDQVWLTEKDPHGATRLYPLTDYKALKAENIERGYVQGRYGAIPFLGALTTWEK